MVSAQLLALPRFNMGGGYNANRMTARDAEDALAALRLLPSRAEKLDGLI